MDFIIFLLLILALAAPGLARGVARAILFFLLLALGTGAFILWMVFQYATTH